MRSGIGGASRGGPAYVHVVFCDLEKVEEAPSFGNFIFVEDSGVGLGEIVGVIFPIDFGSLESDIR